MASELDVSMCAIHGPCGQIPVSPDLLLVDSGYHQGGQGVYEYLVGIPTDPWLNCFVTDSFAVEHGLNLQKGWEEERGTSPIWFKYLGWMCTKCFLSRYPFYWTLRHIPLGE